MREFSSLSQSCAIKSKRGNSDRPVLILDLFWIGSQAGLILDLFWKREIKPNYFVTCDVIDGETSIN